jgi:hypothetical protein
MALAVNFNLCEAPTCTKLEFTDQTGAYNVITNPTGYDENNEVPSQPSTSEFGEASLAITTPANVVYTFDLYPTYPTADKELIYYINGTDLGYTDNKIVDGIYQAVYALATETQSYTVNKYFLLTCQVECCIDKLYAKVTTENTKCISDNIYLASAIEAEGYVCAAKDALACGKIAMAKRFLAKAQSVCSNVNCNCC